MEEKIILNKDGIKEYQQNREPYLFVDYATEVIPGKSAKGYKDLLHDEWFFKVHWPKNPNMPGFLQVEALVQLCALTILCKKGNKGKIVYLTSANNLVFKQKVIPGKRLEMETYLLSYNRGIGICSGKSFFDNKLACSANFKIVFPDDLVIVQKK